ncbi:MAG: ATP-binding protein [Chloroflexi bacterium]|nr:ATP-binding protein [Chloroflexota bacterium]MDA1271734.1 ATP-binding protein [Chloroflexota bacterium]
MRKPGGLLSTILVRTVPIAVLLLLAISIGANQLSERTVRKEVEERLLGDAATQALVIALTLGTLVDSTKTLAVNELIIYAIADSPSRPAYLDPLFRSLQIPGPPVRLSITDQLGRPIATNSGEIMSYENEPWVGDVMSGQDFIDLTASGLTVAVPVRNLGTTVGIMVMDAGPATVAGIVGSGLATSDGMLLHPGGDVLISSVPGIARVGDLDPGLNIDGWLQQRAAIPGFPDHILVNMETEAEALGPVHQIRKFLWAAIGLDLIVLLVGIGMTARLATKPVAALADAVRTARGQSGLGEPVEQTGPRELRELGQAFMETLNDLQNTMADRVQAEAENLRLNEQIKLNAELDRRFQTFMALASHELRTPTTTIMGFSELLLTRDVTEENRREWLTMVHRNSVQLAGIVNDLLNVTRIQSGTFVIKKEDVSLDVVVQEALASIRPATNGHEISVDIPSGLPMVTSDPDKLNQVLINLIGNAVKYSPDGGAVTVHAAHEPSSGRVVVGVKDEGLGIALEDQAMLFKPFSRIRTPETETIDGSGLGLYLVKELVGAMGGEIWLESQRGLGSAFFISLPAAEPNTSPEGFPQAILTDGGDYDANATDC